tara:strand:+ start:207 stop:557 length:351 start_codon:yes stop_codon:yes gene_type:complete
MPPKKIKFNVKKKLPAKQKKAPAKPKPKKKIKFNVKPKERVAKYKEIDPTDPINTSMDFFATPRGGWSTPQKTQKTQKSYSTAEAKDEVASGRAFGGDFYYVPDVIQVQDTDKYFG